MRSVAGGGRGTIYRSERTRNIPSLSSAHLLCVRDERGFLILGPKFHILCKKYLRLKESKGRNEIESEMFISLTN